jgi:hypothetical protein
MLLILLKTKERYHMAKKNFKKENLNVEEQDVAVENVIVGEEVAVVDNVVNEGDESEQVQAVIEEEVKENSLEELPLLPLNAVIDSEAISEAVIEEVDTVDTIAVEDSDTSNMDTIVEDVVEDAVVISDVDTVEIEQEQQEEAVVVNNYEVSLETENTATAVAFRSDSEMARTYIMELLSDGESHKKQDIVAFINQKAGKTFTDATIINVLRNLINNGSLLQLERGSYKIGSGIGLVSKFLSFVDATRKGLEKITTVSVSDITESDLAVINDVKLLRGMLEDMYERLGSK